MPLEVWFIFLVFLSFPFSAKLSLASSFLLAHFLIILSFLLPLPPPLQGLDLVLIKKFPVILHQKPSDPKCAFEGTECCICLGLCKDGGKLKVLPSCDHSFHFGCVDKLLTSHSSCPLCRASLKTKLLCSTDGEVRKLLASFDMEAGEWSRLLFLSSLSLRSEKRFGLQSRLNI